jgi:dynein heavy chain, axonemal
VIVTPELEEVIAALLEYRVPKTWAFCFPSSKPLGSWMRDLGQRCELFQAWVNDGIPKVMMIAMEQHRVIG